MKLVKKLLSIFIFIIIIIALLAWLLAQFVTLFTVKELINDQLHKATGLETHINGNIAWQIFPKPGLRVTHFLIGDKNKPTPYSMDVERLQINLLMAPLIQGHLVFNELQIDGFNLVVNPNGQQPIKTTNANIVTVGLEQPSKAQLSIKNFLLTHGKITIIQAEKTLKFSNLQVEAKNINPNSTLLQVQLRTKIRASVPKNNLESTLNYQGRLQLPQHPFKAPLITLKHLNLEGELLLQNTKINQIKVSNMDTQVMSNSTELRLQPFNCTLYNGASVGDLNYQFASNRLTINQTGTNLNANALFMDLFEKNLIKGSLDFSLHASTQLQDDLWRNTLQGNGTLSIKDGELFINLYESINNAANTVNSLLSDNNDKIKQALQDPLYSPKVPEPGSTSFQWLNVQYTLKDGKFLADSLSLQTPKIQITGKGTIDMNDTSQQIDLQAKILGDHNVVDKIQTIFGGSIPITITGSVLKPIISTNLKGISQLLSRYLLKTTVQKPINAVGKHLKNLLIVPDDLMQNNQQ